MNTISIYPVPTTRNPLPGRLGSMSFERDLNGAQSLRLNKMDNAEAAYLAKRDSFTRTVAQALTTVSDPKKYMAVGVFAKSGRRYDKVMRSNMKLNGKNEDIRVLFFIDNQTGEIYGAKSDVAPNLNHYYGTLDTISHWDWSKEANNGAPAPEPTDLDAAGVTRIKGYGGYTHYTPAKTPKKIAV